MELGNMFFGNSRGEHPVERRVGYERELGRLFALVPGWDDGYGGGDFENETFALRPYCWDDCMCPEEMEGHQAECRPSWPNFEHKPSGYSLKWYKYPLRDSYANKAITVAEFGALIDDCIASLATLADAGKGKR